MNLCHFFLLFCVLLSDEYRARHEIQGRYREAQEATEKRVHC